MTTIWEDFVQTERDGGTSEEEIQNEHEKRESDPALYDCALAVADFDRPDVLAEIVGGVDVNAPTPRSQQPLLYLAITKKRVQSCKILIEKGADTHARQAEKGYLFWAAFSNTDPAIVQMLLEAPGGPPEPITPELLAVAKRRASPELVALLER